MQLRLQPDLRRVRVAIDHRLAHKKDKMRVEVVGKGKKNLKVKKIKRKRKNLRGLSPLEEMVSVPQLQEAVDQISHRKKF